jgi:hypothetical protein
MHSKFEFKRDPPSCRYVSRKVYPSDRYPNYVNGPAYMMTAEAVRALLAQTPQVDQFPMEDVLFTGVLAQAGNVSLYECTDYLRVYGGVIY